LDDEMWVWHSNVEANKGELARAGFYEATRIIFVTLFIL